jgi:tetratricopeptide (TPR) repeat protein
MLRHIPRLAALLTLGFCSFAVAQESDDQWKALVMQALYSAGSNDFAKAEQLFQRALQEAGKFGSGDARVGTTLNSLGLVYKSERKFSEAEASFRKALAILEHAYGYDSIDVANVNFNIATVMVEQGKSGLVFPYLEKSLPAYQRQLGPQSLKAATVFCMIGDAHKSLKEWQEAEASLKQCADIRESQTGVVSSDLGDALFSLAQVLERQGKYGQAEPRYRLAEKIREKTSGIMSPALAEALEAHSAVLKAMGKEAEAAKDSALASAIRRNEEHKK